MRLTALLKWLLFRESVKRPRLQGLWSRLHTMAIFGMNYGGGSVIETSGELWALSELIGPICRRIEHPVLFDVGANVGDYSLRLQSHFPRARIHAFEPAPSVFRELDNRIRQAGGDGNVTCHQTGFSDSERSVDLISYTVEGREASVLSSIDERLPTQVLDVRAGRRDRIVVRTIDGFCADEGIERIDFMKLDVEGHELAVLRGARRMLVEGRISALQFEFGPANIYSRTYLFDFWSMLAATFDLYRIVPHGAVPIRTYGEHLEVFLTTNYLAVRKGASMC